MGKRLDEITANKNFITETLETICALNDSTITSEIDKGLTTKIVVTFNDGSICIILHDIDDRVIIDSFSDPASSNVINVYNVVNLIEVMRQNGIHPLLSPDVLHEAIELFELAGEGNNE